MKDVGKSENDIHLSSRTDHLKLNAVYSFAQHAKSGVGKAHHKFLFGAKVSKSHESGEAVGFVFEGSDNAQADQVLKTHTGMLKENLGPSQSVSLHSSRPLLS
jgi:hypothetical protein